MQNAQKYFFWGKATLFALLLVFAVRTFWVESFLISSSQMDKSLIKGDRVIVNKTAYGLRLPMTPLSMPFTFDNFFGFQSYSTALQLPYKRIGDRRIPRNDVVVFNHPLQSDRPLDKRTLCIARCVAEPGDTISEKDFDFVVKGKTFPSSPDLPHTFSLPMQWKDSLANLLKRLKIDKAKLVEKGNKVQLSINKPDIYRLEEKLSDSDLVVFDRSQTNNFQLIVPRKEWKMTLKNNPNINTYLPLIQQEQEKDVIIKNGKLFIGGKLAEAYTFKENYYWLLPDKRGNGIGSNVLGFVSEKNIVGKASFVWFSANSNRISWERILSAVN